MTPEQLFNWVAYQYALVLSGHRILLEPIFSADAASTLRDLAPAPGADASLHETYVLGPVLAQPHGATTLLTGEVDDRTFREERGEVVHVGERLLISLGTTSATDRVLSMTIAPRSEGTSGDSEASNPMRPTRSHRAEAAPPS